MLQYPRCSHTLLFAQRKTISVPQLHVSHWSKKLFIRGSSRRCSLSSNQDVLVQGLLRPGWPAKGTTYFWTSKSWRVTRANFSRSSATVFCKAKCLDCPWPLWLCECTHPLEAHWLLLKVVSNRGSSSSQSESHQSLDAKLRIRLLPLFGMARPAHRKITAWSMEGIYFTTAIVKSRKNQKSQKLSNRKRVSKYRLWKHLYPHPSFVHAQNFPQVLWDI